MQFVSIGNTAKEVKLYDTPGGIVKLRSAITVDQQAAINKKYGTTVEDPDKQIEMSYEIVMAAFIEWNIGENGTALPCTKETLSKFTIRDFFAMLQACSGRKLLDDEGNMLTVEEISKKGKSA